MFLGQNLSGPEEKNKKRTRGGIIFPLVPCMQNHSACRRQNLVKEEMQGRERTWRGVDGGLLAGLRWRGSWTAAPDGVAVLVDGGERFPLSPVFFRSRCSSLRQSFPSTVSVSLCFRFVCALPLSFARSFSSPSIFGSPSLLRSLSIYREEKETGVPFASAPSITQRLVGQ